MNADELEKLIGRPGGWGWCLRGGSVLRLLGPHRLQLLEDSGQQPAGPMRFLGQTPAKRKRDMVLQVIHLIRRLQRFICATGDDLQPRNQPGAVILVLHPRQEKAVKEAQEIVEDGFFHALRKKETREIMAENFDRIETLAVAGIDDLAARAFGDVRGPLEMLA